MYVYDKFEKAKPAIFDRVGRSFDMNLDDLVPTVRPVAIKKDPNLPRMEWTYELTFKYVLNFEVKLDVAPNAKLIINLDDEFNASGALVFFSTINGVSEDFKSTKIYFGYDEPSCRIEIRYKENKESKIVNISQLVNGTVIEAISKANHFFEESLIS
jgi:hypothetical protein